MRQSNAPLFMMLFVIATVCFAIKAVSQAGTTSVKAQGGTSKVSPNQLSLLGISIGEEVSSAVQTMDSIGFITSACIVRNPYSKWDSLCFQRGTGESFSLAFKNGTLGGATYQFSGSKYEVIWNRLFKEYGKPRAYLGNRGGWLADVWQDESMKDEIQIMKIVDGTGTVTLGSADTPLKSMVVKFSNSPNEYSMPISGKLGQRQETPARNTPHPSFQGELSLFGLHGGESKSEALKVLGKVNEAVCHFDQSDYTTKCTLTKGSFGWSVDFYENRLGSYRVTFPANNWNQQVASIKVALHAEPTDIEKNTTELLITWKSTVTVPCAADATKKCPTEIILLNTNSRESEATLNYMFLPVENKVIEDETRRAMSKFHSGTLLRDDMGFQEKNHASLAYFR